jgi:biopolymer transport protein ExbD
MNDDDGNEPLAEINMIPLIDVMLVLLVIFIVTAPLLTHAVKVDLPKASSQPNLTKPDNVQLAIDGAGQVYWNGEAVAAPALEQKLRAAAAADAATRAAPACRAHDALRKGRRSHVRRGARRAHAHRLRDGTDT